MRSTASRASDEVLRKAAGTAIRALAGRGAASPSRCRQADAAAVAEGAALAAYSVKAPTPGKGPVENIVVLGERRSSALPRAEILADAVALARELGNLPANLLPPAVLANRGGEPRPPPAASR